MAYKAIQALSSAPNIAKTVRPWLFGKSNSSSWSKQFAQYASRTGVKYGTLGAAVTYGLGLAADWAKENFKLLAGVAVGAIVAYKLAKSSISTVVKWGAGIAATVGLAYFANQYFGNKNPLAAIVPDMNPSAIANPKPLALKDTIKKIFKGATSPDINEDVNKNAVKRGVIDTIEKAEDATVLKLDTKTNALKRSATEVITEAENSTTLKTSVPSVPRLENPESVAVPVENTPRTSVPSIPLNKGTTLGASQHLTKLKSLKAGIGSRVAGNIPIVGPAFGVGAAGLTTYAHTVQRDYADALLQDGTLSKGAHEAYNSLNKKVQAMFSGDIALSTVDPTGLSIISTLGAEGTAQKYYKDWADKHAPNLNNDALQGLNMSWFSADNAQTEMMKKVADYIPTDIKGQPAVLHEVIAARKDFIDTVTSHKINPYAKMIHDPAKRAAALEANKIFHEKSMETQAIFKDKMAELVSNPQNIQTYLNLVPLDEKLSHITRLAKSDAGTQLLQSHPQIAEYMDKHSKSWTGWFIEKPSAVSVDNFITSANCIKTQITQTPKPSSASAKASAPKIMQ